MAISVKKRYIVYFIDALIILLHITYGMSMLKVWILDPIPLPHHLDILLITSLVFLFRFGFSLHLLFAEHKGIVWLFIIIYVVDVFQNLFLDTTKAIDRLIFLLDIILFMEYVYSMYLESKKVSEKPTKAVTKHYELYALYNVFAVVLCLILIYLGILSPSDNPMSNNTLIDSNVSTGAQYYFPGHLSLALANQRGLSFFDLPVLTGLSHEPHVLFLLIGPCFFILLDKVKNHPFLSVLLYVVVFAMLIIATSTTAIITFIIVFAIEQFYSFFIGERKVASMIVLFVILGIGVWFMRVGSEIIGDVSAMMDDKLSVAYDEGSKGFSVSMLNYMVSPESFLGRGNMPEGTGFQLSDQDIGYVTCILDLLFALVFMIKTIRNVFSKDRQIHYYGMALLYFFIHNLKLSVQSFSFQYMSFFVILLVIIDNETKRIKSKIKIMN